MRTWPLGVAVLVCATTSADAGRTHFGWQYGTELNPERGVEVETWIIDMHRLNKAGGIVDDETGFWWGMVVAVSEHVELAIPIEAEYVDNRDPASPPATNFIRFGGEVRWRPQSPDPIEAGPLTSLFRLGVKRMIDERLGIRSEFDVVTAYRNDVLIASVDLGVIEEHVLNGGGDVFEFRPAAGISFRIDDGFRVGAETYGELTVKGTDPSWQVIGPTISLTRGRFWGAATFGPGLIGVREAGRITFGAAL